VVWVFLSRSENSFNFLVTCYKLLHGQLDISRTDGLEQNFSTTTLVSTPLNTALGIHAIARLRPAHIAHTVV
jgi:hypothetical protein